MPDCLMPNRTPLSDVMVVELSSVVVFEWCCITLYGPDTVAVGNVARLCMLYTCAYTLCTCSIKVDGCLAEVNVALSDKKIKQVIQARH